MVSNKQMKDVRSTGRRRARKALFEAYVPFKCVGYKNHPCGKTVITPPKDAPSWFDEIWPEENRVLTSSLQADHESKDLENNDIQFLNWRCASCHKKQDNSSDKGIATVQHRSLW